MIMLLKRTFLATEVHTYVKRCLSMLLSFDQGIPKKSHVIKYDRIDTNKSTVDCMEKK